MKNKKKLTKIAKAMFAKSLDNGLVNPQKVRQVLKVTTSRKLPGLLAILKKYKRLIEAKLAKEEVTIETATILASQKKLGEEIIRKTAAKRVRYKLNPKMVFGAKITQGNWVWDTTLGAKLKQLTIDVI